MNGVIKTATGRLIRKGSGVDFLNDGSFDENQETYRTDVPEDAIVFKGDISVPYSVWNGIEWIIYSPTSNETLDQRKKEKCDKIDKRTRELIDEGFSFNGKLMSLSNAAQSNGHGLEHGSAKGWNSYPRGISTKDNDELVINDSVELDSYYQTGLNAAASHYDSGRSLKLQCMQATDQAELDLVIDNR